MSETSRIALAVLTVAVIAAPSAARADTLVFPVDAPDTATGTRLTRALLAGAEGEKPRLADTPLGEAASLLECDAAARACLDSMAQAMEASALLAAAVRPAGQKLAARITYHRRGQEPATREVELPSDPEAAAPLLERQVRALIRGEGPVAADPVAPSPSAVAERTAEPRGDPAITASSGDSASGFSLGRVRPWSWAVAGGGALLVGVGAAFALKASSLEGDVEDAPRETVADFEHLKDLEEEGDSATTLSNVLLLGGGIALVTGAGLIIWQGMTPTAEERGRLTVAPTPLRGGAGLVLSGELP
ncbi:MAG TPA: hypothetical protein VFU21_26970 [Kofleriaceae bacterium]|nr:hypothetical protein [Kofleriaceae bacterium]